MMEAVIPPKVFEAVNGTLFIACLCLLFIFGKFLHLLWRDHRRSSHRVHAFYKEAAPALALFVIIFGDAFIRGPVWFSRWMINHHHDDPFQHNAVMVTILIFGVVVALCGMWCTARVYGSKMDGRITVFVSLLVGLGLAFPW